MILDYERDYILDFWEKLLAESVAKHLKGGDYSKHPINEKLVRVGFHSA